ncbi:hypothetical protein A2V82_14010 [candidate division KSB1 bacterium RBG_16_48_16]|nr:MAG: hypothetical protein A2V82_14010 [candidate division KSB1 bacterium RBG_16_48_16]
MKNLTKRMPSFLDKLKALGGYKKRSFLYAGVGALGLLYELFSSRPIRPVVAILWIAVIGIGIIVLVTFRDAQD